MRTTTRNAWAANVIVIEWCPYSNVWENKFGRKSELKENPPDQSLVFFNILHAHNIIIIFLPPCIYLHSCTSCIGDNRCVWCPFSFSCIQPGRTCTANQDEVGKTVHHSSVLPRPLWQSGPLYLLGPFGRAAPSTYTVSLTSIWEWNQLMWSKTPPK